MLRNVALSTVVAVALVGCQKPTAAMPDNEEAVPRPASAPAVAAVMPMALATPIPETTAPVVAPQVVTTPKPELAPPGVFYLLTTARVETPNGIVGMKPGTGVKLVRPGIYLTPYGERPLSSQQLTNDMGLARQAVNQDVAQQAAQQAQLKKALEARAVAASPSVAASSTEAVQLPSASVPAMTAPPSQPRLESRSLLNRAGGPSLSTGKVDNNGGTGVTHSNTKDKVYIDEYGKPYWRDVRGRPRYDF